MQHFNFAFIIYWEIITNTCITMLNCNNYLTCKSTVKRVSQRKGPSSFLIRVCLSGFSIRDSHTSPMATRLSWCSLINSSTPSRSCQKIMKTAINVGTWVIKETRTCIWRIPLTITSNISPVFKMTVEVITQLQFLRLAIGWKISCQFSTNEKADQNQLHLVHSIFRTLWASYR